MSDGGERVVIRRAMMQDLGQFKQLWSEFLEDQAKRGDLVLANDHNLDIAVNVFRTYVSGDVLGLVQFLNVNGKDVGVYMEGELPGGYQLSIGRYTMLFGVYYRPEYQGKKYTHLMYEKAMVWTRKHKLEGGITAYLTNNAKAADVTSKVIDGNLGGSEIRTYSVNLYWTFQSSDSGSQ